MENGDVLKYYMELEYFFLVNINLTDCKDSAKRVSRVHFAGI